MTSKIAAKYKLVHGVGINDADYHVEVNGVYCPYYLKWKTMLARCYTTRYKAYNKTYEGCNVCDEWLTFSNFKAWMEKQDWEGKHLDKDLLGDGKLYSPETCCFLEPRINSFISDKPVGKYRAGVGKNYNRFFARCCNPFTSKRERLGTYGCETAAHLAYIRQKHKHAVKLSYEVDNESLAVALRNRYV